MNPRPLADGDFYIFFKDFKVFKDIRPDIL